MWQKADATRRLGERVRGEANLSKAEMALGKGMEGGHSTNDKSSFWVYFCSSRNSGKGRGDGPGLGDFLG